MTNAGFYLSPDDLSTEMRRVRYGGAGAQRRGHETGLGDFSVARARLPRGVAMDLEAICRT